MVHFISVFIVKHAGLLEFGD